MSEKPTIYLKSRQMPKRPCPNCTRLLDGITGAAEDPEGTIPTVGSITICAYCGVVLVIEELGFAFAPPEALDELAPVMRQAIEGAIKRPIWIGPSTART